MLSPTSTGAAAVHNGRLVQVEVNGTRLWFDVEGAGLVPDGSVMREKPALLLVHGGPGSYDHSYFKPHFSRLTDLAQVVYLDLRDHGRSQRHDPAQWSYEVCADDIRMFCDAIGLARPIVLGHSMGSWIVLLYGARHPGHAGGLIAQSGMARFDLDRLVEGFRRVAGDAVADIARRGFLGEDMPDEEWAPAFAAYGPNVPSPDELARRSQNLEVDASGQLMRALDILDQLPAITSPTLVHVGDADAVTPVEASQEIYDHLEPAVRRLEILPGAGHFPWLDDPDRYFAAIADFIRTR
jgi:proline iminopeptidase